MPNTTLLQQERKHIGMEIPNQAEMQRREAQQAYQGLVEERVERQIGSRTYAQFYQNLKPLPMLPVAQGALAQQNEVSAKERKRQEKQRKKQSKKDFKNYKSLNQYMASHPVLLDEASLRQLPVFQTKQGRDKWANEVLPHSELTREQTMKKILDENDFSNFENLDHVMRNMIASKALAKFTRDYHITRDSDPQQVCAEIQNRTAGVSGLLNPALRLALSLAQRSEGISPEMKNFYRELDEAMSTAVMVATLTSRTDEDMQDEFVGEFEERYEERDDIWDIARQRIEEHKAQQIQIAKRLLLMQASNFKKITTDKDGNVTETDWDKSMAVALSHCSRVVLTMPKQDKSTSDEDCQKEMWKAIYTIGGENIAQDNSRSSSTHSIKRRSVDEQNGAVKTKEKKVLFNLTGQRGMNCAIGGLLNHGAGTTAIINDGSCGHFYSMYKNADATHYGAMLMGLESDAAYVTNQLGHTHDIHATAEKASSLGGQRIDEVGDKYGGRQCDLTHRSATDITALMLALERKMLEWQSQDGGLTNGEAYETMQLLAGKKMDAAQWSTLMHTLFD